MLATNVCIIIVVVVVVVVAAVAVEAARTFVYTLGAERLDTLLSAKTEEAIRGLVYSVTHDRVNDLREVLLTHSLTHSLTVRVVA